MADTPAVKPRRIDFLDPLRGLAIALVYGYHCIDLWFPVSAITWQGVWRVWPVGIPWWGCLLSVGWVGVSLFFVLSGFCIHLSHQNTPATEAHPWRRFILRRFFRIYPPYITVFLVLWRLSLVRHHTVSTLSVVGHIGLLHNWLPGHVYDVNASLWSVAVEWQLYLLYPLLLLFSRYLGWPTSLTLAAIGEILLQSLSGFQVDLSVVHLSQRWLGLSHSPFGYWFSWSLGAALADAYLKRQPFMQERWQIPLWLALSGLGLVFKPLHSLVFLYVALLTASAMARSLCPVKAGGTVIPGKSWVPAWVLRHWAFVGTISYSVYLVHQPIISVFPWMVKHQFPSQLAGQYAFWTGMLLWPVVLIIGWVLFLVLEKPCIQFNCCARPGTHIGLITGCMGV
jgi:peptidoglycan/LPS O-acetylase OafA/YrhL